MALLPGRRDSGVLSHDRRLPASRCYLVQTGRITING